MLIPVNNPKLLEFIADELQINFDRISDSRWKRIDEAITKTFLETIAQKEVLERLLDKEGTKKILAAINKKLWMNSLWNTKPTSVDVEDLKNVNLNTASSAEGK